MTRPPSIRAALALVALSFSMVASIRAQDTDDRGTNPKVWEAELPGGNYVVRVDRISSVSIHEYVVDGIAIVREVNIGTDTAGMVRFYSLVPVVEDSSVGAVGSVLERVKAAGSAASAKITGQDESLTEKVQKNYPGTTHARTIEFRIPTPEALEALYGSAKDALIKGRGDRVTIAPAQ